MVEILIRINITLVCKIKVNITMGLPEQEVNKILIERKVLRLKTATEEAILGDNDQKN